MHKNFMLKRNFKDCPAPTCIKYNTLTQHLQQKNYKYKVQQMVDSQKGVIAEVIKRKSKTMPSFSFGSKKQEPAVPQYTGFPLKFFEDQTYLERIAEWFTTVPYFLESKKLKENRDPEFRFKEVVKMVLSTLYMTVKPSKPFNPILGETYQGFLCLDPKLK